MTFTYKRTPILLNNTPPFGNNLILKLNMNHLLHSSLRQQQQSYSIGQGFTWLQCIIIVVVVTVPIVDGIVSLVVTNIINVRKKRTKTGIHFWTASITRSTTKKKDDKLIEKQQKTTIAENAGGGGNMGRDSSQKRN